MTHNYPTMLIVGIVANATKSVRDWSGYEAKASAIVPHRRGGDQRKPPQAVLAFCLSNGLNSTKLTYQRLYERTKAVRGTGGRRAEYERKARPRAARRGDTPKIKK